MDPPKTIPLLPWANYGILGSRELSCFAFFWGSGFDTVCALRMEVAISQKALCPQGPPLTPKLKLHVPKTNQTMAFLALMAPSIGTWTLHAGSQIPNRRHVRHFDISKYVYMYIHMASIYACTYGRYSESCDIIREASHVLLEAEACKYPSAYRLGRVEWQGPLNLKPFLGNRLKQTF